LLLEKPFKYRLLDAIALAKIKPQKTKTPSRKTSSKKQTLLVFFLTYAIIIKVNIINLFN